MTIADVVVAALVLVPAGYLLYRSIAKGARGCGGCGGACSTRPPGDEPVVQLRRRDH